MEEVARTPAQKLPPLALNCSKVEALPSSVGIAVLMVKKPRLGATTVWPATEVAMAARRAIGSERRAMMFELDYTTSSEIGFNWGKQMQL